MATAKYITLLAFTCGRYFYHKYLASYPWAQKIAQRIAHSVHQYTYEFVPPAKRTKMGFKNINASWSYIEDVMTFRNSRLLAKNGYAYLPMLEDADIATHTERYFTQEEITHVVKFSGDRRHLVAETPHPFKIIQEPCISLIGPVTSNWMHWLTEIIPQIISAHENLDVPCVLLMEEDLPRQIFETVRLLFPDSAIVLNDSKRCILCKKLYVPTYHKTNWSMFWSRNTEQWNKGAFHFDRDALLKVRHALLKAAGVDNPSLHSDKIFIRRNSNFRVAHNQTSAENMLVDRGFRAIDPSILTAQQQVELFSSASIVVSQTGAAMANLMFMPEGGHAIFLAADNDYINYDYFHDYASILGLNSTYCLSAPLRKKEGKLNQMSVNHPINDMFSIDLEQLAAILDKLEG